MTSTAPPPAPAPPPSPADGLPEREPAPSDAPRASAPLDVGRVGGLLVVAVAVVAAVLLAGSGASAQTLLLALGAAAVGVALALCVLLRFSLFVLAFLVVRPVVDAVDVGSVGSSGLVSSALGALLVGPGVVWLAAQAAAGRLRPPSLLVWALLALVASFVTASLQSAAPLPGLQQAARSAAVVVLVAVLHQVLVTAADVRRTAWALALAPVVPLVVGAVQLGTGRGLADSQGILRAVATFEHPNTFGFFLVLVLTAVVASWRHLTPGLRLAATPVALLAGVELLSTYSRGGWLTLTVCLLVVAAVQSRVLFLVLPLGGAVAALAVPGVAARFSDLTESQSVYGTEGNSFIWRTEQWGDLLAQVDLADLLLGQGPQASVRLTGAAPHNDFVRVLVENGLVGLVAYVAVLVALLALGVRCLGEARTPLARATAVTSLAVSVGFVVNSFGANLVNQVVLLTYVMALAALADGARRVQGTSPAERDEDAPRAAEGAAVG